MASTLNVNFTGRAASVIVREELERAKQIISAHIIANGQNASGRTIKSLHVEVSQDEGTLFGRSPFGTLETGRRAGKVPYGFRRIIMQWMQDKGIHGTPIAYKTNRPHKYTPQERGDMSMAGAIAHTIATKGSALHRKGGRSNVYSNVIPDTMERVKSRIGALVMATFDSIRLNNTSI